MEGRRETIVDTVPKYSASKLQGEEGLAKRAESALTLWLLRKETAEQKSSGLL